MAPAALTHFIPHLTDLMMSYLCTQGPVIKLCSHIRALSDALIATPKQARDAPRVFDVFLPLLDLIGVLHPG